MATQTLLLSVRAPGVSRWWNRAEEALGREAMVSILPTSSF